ncbi:ribonuclease H-like domain-containing protein [Tanacetum coccineum]
MLVLMACNSSGSDTEREQLIKDKGLEIDLDDKTDVLTYHKKLLAEAQKEKEDLKAKVEKWHNSSKNLDCSVKTHESLPEPTVNEPKVVNQPKVWSDAPIIEEYESDSEDEHVSQPTKEQEHYLSHLIRDCDFHEKRTAKQAELNNSIRKKTSQREIRPIWNNVQRVDHKNQFVPQPSILTGTGKIPINTARASGTNNVSTARHHFNRHAVPNNADMKVNTVKPIVNKVKPANVFYKSHSPLSKPFNNTTALRKKISYQKVNTAEENAVSAVGGEGKLLLSPQQVVIGDKKDITGKISPYTIVDQVIEIDYPHRALKHKGIVDSGCSRHMTGNKAYLAEYQDFNGGHVAFGGSKGYITSKGIKREYSNAKTPQQNGVAERKNRTRIEAARTMLADSFLPNTFWAEAVSTACYVLNRFDGGNHDKGFSWVFVLQSRLLGKGPTWLFDLDYLTDSMNYQPVRSENQANKHAGPQEANHNAGTKDNIDAGDSEKEDESAQDYFVLPIWSSYSSTVKRSTEKDAGEAPNKHPDLQTDENPVEKEDQVFLEELERLKRQEKDANDAAEALRKEFAQETEDLLLQAGVAKTSSTNIVNTASTPVSTASPYGGLSFTDPTNPDQDDSEIPALEDIYQNPTDGIFTNSSYDDEGAVADFTNLEPVVNVSPIPTSRITSIHPSTLILGDPQSAVQTRSKVTKSSGAHAFVSYIQKQRRNNHKDFQHCLFACFLSQNEPKKISEALEDESWVDAMQEELLQFKIQKVWILVDLPYGKKAIGTK